MPIQVPPTRNPNPARVSGPLWWLVCQLLANWPGTTNGGTFAAKTGSHDTRDGQSSSNYSTRDPLNRLGPGNKAAAFDLTFPSAQNGNFDQIVQFGIIVAEAWANGDPRAEALFEVLVEADYDYDPEGFVWYPVKKKRTPDRTHKWHAHLGFLRVFMGEDGVSWAKIRKLASLLCREPLSVWLAGKSVFDPSAAAAKGDDMVQVLIKIDGEATVYFTTMGIGSIPITSEPELANWKKWMTDNNMGTTVWGWPPTFRHMLGPMLTGVAQHTAVLAAVAGVQTDVRGDIAADQARDAATAAAVGALASTIDRLVTTGGGSIETGAIVEAVTDAVREAGASHTAATTAIYNELIAAREEITRLRNAAFAGARGTADALEPQ